MTLKAFARAIGGPAISSWPWEVRIPRGQDLTQAQPLARPLLDFLIEHGNRPDSPSASLEAEIAGRDTRLKRLAWREFHPDERRFRHA